jgi:MFS family permease
MSNGPIAKRTRAPNYLHKYAHAAVPADHIRDLGVKDNDGTVFWSAVAFGAAFRAAATVSPIWGWLADLYGRKPMLIRASLGMAIAMSMMGRGSRNW